MLFEGKADYLHTSLCLVWNAKMEMWSWLLIGQCGQNRAGTKQVKFTGHIFILGSFQNAPCFFLVMKSTFKADPSLTESSLNFRIGVSCLLPASWHFSISPMGCPRIFNTTLRQIVVIGILAAAVSLLYYSLVVIRNKYGRASRDKRFHRWVLKRLWWEERSVVLMWRMNWYNVWVK